MIPARFRKQLFPVLGGIALLLLPACVARAQLVVSVNGFVVTDNSGFDLDTADDSIQFDSQDPISGFAVPGGGFTAEGLASSVTSPSMSSVRGSNIEVTATKD